MESGCFAISICIEIYASGVVFGYGFNLLCPCNWCFEVFFFPPGARAVFLREGYAG
jgi:nitrate reductase NapE component